MSIGTDAAPGQSRRSLTDATRGSANVTVMPHSGADAPVSVLAAIRSMLDVLPPGEARVAQAVLDQPLDAIGWSAQELADLALTSPPTVVRACRRLGFGGLPELRLALAREVGWTRIPVVEGPDTAGGVRETFTNTARAVAEVGDQIDPVVFAEAARLMGAARRLLFVCAGPTQVVCRDAVFDLNSIGRVAEFSDDPIMQRVLAAHLTAEDVCVAVGLSGQNELTLQAVEAAKRAGATVVTVGGSPRSAMSALGDVSLHLSAADVAAATHGTAVLISMIVLFRAVTGTIARSQGTSHPAPLSEIFDSALMRRASHRRS